MFAGYIHKLLDDWILSWPVLLLGPLVLFAYCPLDTLFGQTYRTLAIKYLLGLIFPIFPSLLKLTAMTR